MNQLVFVCSPYRGNVAANVAEALAACREIVAEGNVPFAPHLFFTLFLDDSDPKQREAGLRMSLFMLALCDVVNVYRPRHLATDGMRREIREAERLNKPIVVKA